MCRSNLPAKNFVNMTELAREFWKNSGVTPPTAQKSMPFLEKKKKLSILTYDTQIWKIKFTKLPRIQTLFSKF